MTRFVVLTFAFLGWAFYEVSGGGEFEFPLLASSGATEPAAGELAEGDAIIENAEQAEDTTPDTIVLASLPMRALVSEPEPITRQFSLDDAIAAEISQEPALRDFSGDMSVSGSVGVRSYGLTTADIRLVRGNRVNVRNGPGKSYAHVATLSRGEEVEVLENAQRGWVELRIVETGEIGWMAEFLLVEVN